MILSKNKILILILSFLVILKTSFAMKTQDVDYALKTIDGNQKSPINTIVTCGDYFFSGSFDGSITQWSLKTEKPIKSFKAHKGIVGEIIVINNTTISCGDNTIKFWDSDTCKCIKTYVDKSIKKGDYIRSIIAGTHNCIIAGSRNGIVSIWDIATGKMINSTNVYFDYLERLFRAEDELIITDFFGYSTLWDINTGEFLKVFNIKEKPLSVIASYKDCMIFNKAEEGKNSIGIWDFSTNTLIKSIDKTSWLQAIITPDELIFSVSHKKILDIWTLDGLLISSYKLKHRPTAMTVADDGTVIIGLWSGNFYCLKKS